VNKDFRSKNGGHCERRAAIGRRNMPHHSYTRLTSGSKEVPACVRNIFNALIFGNISSACAKEYLITAMLVEVKVRDRIADLAIE